MKFTKPINRELDIDGNTFIVSFDQNGIDFRVKGKRKTAHTDWNKVLEIAKGEDGTSAHEILGVKASKSEQHETERQEQIFAPQTASFNPSQDSNPHFQEDTSAQPQTGNTNVSEYSQEERAHQVSGTAVDDDSREEFGRAVTAGETRRES